MQTKVLDGCVSVLQRRAAVGPTHKWEDGQVHLRTSSFNIPLACSVGTLLSSS